MENKIFHVCCKIDQMSGRERRLCIMTENQLNNSRKFWEYTRIMSVPIGKVESLHLGNIEYFLSQYEVF